MICYHEGNGVLVEIAGTSRQADLISYDDTLTHLNVTNVQRALEALYRYFIVTFPGWFD